MNPNERGRQNQNQDTDTEQGGQSAGRRNQGGGANDDINE